MYACSRADSPLTTGTPAKSRPAAAFSASSNGAQSSRETEASAGGGVMPRDAASPGGSSRTMPSKKNVVASAVRRTR
jgi:hypothetical protein